MKYCQLMACASGEDGDPAHTIDYFNLCNYDRFNLKVMCSEK